MITQKEHAKTVQPKKSKELENKYCIVIVVSKMAENSQVSIITFLVINMIIMIIWLFSYIRFLALYLSAISFNYTKIYYIENYQFSYGNHLFIEQIIRCSYMS